jgi:hypothetical protein
MPRRTSFKSEDGHSEPDTPPLTAGELELAFLRELKATSLDPVATSPAQDAWEDTSDCD